MTWGQVTPRTVFPSGLARGRDSEARAGLPQNTAAGPALHPALLRPLGVCRGGLRGLVLTVCPLRGLRQQPQLLRRAGQQAALDIWNPVLGALVPWDGPWLEGGAAGLGGWRGLVVREPRGGSHDRGRGKLRQTHPRQEPPAPRGCPTPPTQHPHCCTGRWWQGHCPRSGLKTVY